MYYQGQSKFVLSALPRHETKTWNSKCSISGRIAEQLFAFRCHFFIVLSENLLSKSEAHTVVKIW
jgi:hypothetical protein